MKRFKKIFSILFIALFTMISVISPVSAIKSSSTTTGSITIENAVKGENYSIYQMLKIASFDVNENKEGKVSYIVDNNWLNFFSEGKYASYFDVTNETPNKEHYVILKSAPADMEQFAKDALAYAKEHNIQPTSTVTATDTQVEWENLELGYYLVESTVGVICSIDSTLPDATIREKNSLPSIDKVMGAGLKINNGSIGDIVDYTITINNIGGKKNVKVVDTITEGLTYYDMDISFVVKTTINDVVTTLTKNTDYTLEVVGNTFTLKLLNVESMSKNVVITINYKAQINEKSVTNVANINEADLYYGNNTKVEGIPTKTYTYGFEIHKTDGTNALEGAKFKLYDANTEGNEIKVVLVKTEDGVNYYRVATEAEKANAVEIVAGKAVIDGLAVGTYYLEETFAPEGYNKLATRVAVSVSLNNEGQFFYLDQGIINTTGSVLPSTGGMGTAMFITFGSLITIVAGIVLITKFRMTKENA